MTDTAYPIKHWMAVLFLGPLISGLCSYFWGAYDQSYIAGFFWFFIIGLMYGAPSLVLYYGAFWFWIRNVNDLFQQKLLPIIIALGLLVLTFMILGGIDDFFPYVKMGYPAAIILSGFFIRIRVPEKKSRHLE
jgi:hypothetical protein